MSRKKDGKEMDVNEVAAEEVREQEAQDTAAAEEAESGVKTGKTGRAARKENELKKELEEVKAASEAALSAEKDKYLRLAAEYDNYRRRSQKERESVYQDAKADTVLALLPVYDNLARALKTECGDAAFYKGVEMTMNQLMEIFTKLGVTPVESEGQPFDPAVHNAVIHVEDESLGENIVAEEFQKGFMLGEKVIRFAMVKVAN